MVNGVRKFDKVEYVNIESIEEHPEVKNIRSDINKTDVRELMDSIKTDGVRVPVNCFKQDGKIYIINGWRRRRAVQELLKEDPKTPIKEIPVLFVEYDKENMVRDATFDNLVDNIHRKDVNPMDMAKRIENLIERGIGKQEICNRLNKKIGWLNGIMDVLKAEPEVQKQLKEGGMTLDDAKKTSKLPPETQATVAKGIGAARASGDKKQIRKIKKGLDEATRTRSHAAPSKMELKYTRNILNEIMIEMKKQEADSMTADLKNKLSETKLVEWYTLTGCYNMMKYVLGETRQVNFEKIAAKYNIPIAKDGTREKPKKEKTKSKPKKKESTKKKTKKSKKKSKK